MHFVHRRLVSQCQSNIARLLVFDSLFSLHSFFVVVATAVFPLLLLFTIQMSMYFSYWLDIYLLIENATELFKSCGKAFIVSISFTKTPGREHCFLSVLRIVFNSPSLDVNRFFNSKLMDTFLPLSPLSPLSPYLIRSHLLLMPNLMSENIKLTERTREFKEKKN